MLHNRTQVCDHLPLRSWGCSACGHCGYAGQCSTWWQRRPGRSQHRCSWKESRWLSTNTEHGPDITQQTEAAVPLWHTTTTPRVLTSRFTSQLIPHWPHTVENPFTVSLPRMNHLLFQSLLLCAAGLKKKKKGTLLGIVSRSHGSSCYFEASHVSPVEFVLCLSHSIRDSVLTLMSSHCYNLNNLQGWPQYWGPPLTSGVTLWWTRLVVTRLWNMWMWPSLFPGMLERVKALNYKCTALLGSIRGH